MAGHTRYSVNFESPISVYAQIENQILFEITSGRLKAGDRAPSGRDLALLLGVNPNTVMKAYRELDIMGIVESRRGVGVTVTEEAPKIAGEKASRMVVAHLCEAVAECVAVGMKASQVRSLVSDALHAGNQPYTAK
jgi:GntR family transcriptional regulator